MGRRVNSSSCGFIVLAVGRSSKEAQLWVGNSSSCEFIAVDRSGTQPSLFWAISMNSSNCGS